MNGDLEVTADRDDFMQSHGWKSISNFDDVKEALSDGKQLLADKEYSHVHVTSGVKAKLWVLAEEW